MRPSRVVHLLLLAACVPESSDVGGDSDTDAPSGLDRDRDGVVTPDDCDDANPLVRPGAAEACNGADDDCDGLSDEDDEPMTGEGVIGPAFRDRDVVGYGDDTTQRWFCTVPGPGWIARGGDCDDGDPNVRPGFADTCEGDTGPMPGWCGDAHQDVGETCDDGNARSEDGCSATCRIESCGDRVVQAGLGETCDDGNTLPDDGCGPTCREEGCGDGVVQDSRGEACDDGNQEPGDGCSATCGFEGCGNDRLDSGEACDDGNRDDGDGCTATCRLETTSFRITVLEATVRSKAPSGDAWDAGTIFPGPDPYVKVIVGGTTEFSTDVILESFAPVWNDAGIVAVGTAQSVVFEVIDDDSFAGVTTVIQRFTVGHAELTQAMGRGTQTKTGTYATSFRFSVAAP